MAFGLLPILALLLGAGAGYLKWEDSSRRDADRARTESVQVAKDSTVALLSYKAETVEKDLGAARDRLTGSFLDAYTQLVNNVVIPGAKEKKISAVAQVPCRGIGVGQARPRRGAAVREPDRRRWAPTRRPTPPPACG